MNLYESVVEKYRQRMVDIAGKHGYTAKETVRASQHLDKLLNMSSQPTHQSTNRSFGPIKKS
ncbi:aspartyl-phosphate phosphatase Spo0E family protein [Metabacillus sp. 113a]|uniref:aspartyl-phosphate phosphatase Spo0E family protein n=1 Tax=Metabacillus sp. 113a TaxID=3404706 RepID=UPI003CF9F2D0